MPRPYNQKTVKDALLLLDIYASNNCSFEEAASGAEVRPSSTGYRVAEHLIDKLADMFPEERLAVVSGEAAGLLREGWRIGDEIPQHANTQLANKIIEQTYSPDVVTKMVESPNPLFAMITRDSNGFDNNEVAVHAAASEVLAEPLDAVEEPTDEMIAHAFDDDPDPVTTEIVDNSTDYEYDTTEPTE